jgi:lantibiotic modifying enzyme
MIKWQPIIHEHNKELFSKKLENIAQALKNQCKDSDDVGLMTGQTGIALFFFYYSRFTDDQQYYDYALELLEKIVEKLNEDMNLHTFCSGIGGIGWTFEHLTQKEFFQADIGEILSELDPFLFQSMRMDIKRDYFDFMHGALGSGFYFLQRYQHSRNPLYMNYLIQLIDYLLNSGSRDSKGFFTWETILNHEKGNRGFNLGLAHGMPGIMTFLSKLYELDIDKTRILPLLQGTVGYLLSQRLDTSNYHSVFPRHICKEEPLCSSRLGWCYGDTGIGITLWLTGQRLKNHKWKDIAIETLLHSTLRKDPQKNSVFDTCFCHGTSGVAHMYNRIFQYTGLKEFKEACNFWLKKTLEIGQFQEDESIGAGFKFWHGEGNEGHWVNEYNVLNGIAGIGLVLISALSDIEPAWDSCFLLS